MSNLYDLTNDIQVRAEGRLRLITLNRPDDLNASTTEMLMSYPKLFRGVAEDPEARVAILTGAGRAFSARGDFQHFIKTLDDSDFARAVLVDDEMLESETATIAARLAAGPPVALRYIKENVHAALDESLERAVEIESCNMIRTRLTQDSKEAMTAFFEKREPRFRGL